MRKNIGSFLLVLLLTGCGTVQTNGSPSNQGVQQNGKTFQAQASNSIVRFNLEYAKVKGVTRSENRPNQNVTVQLPLHPKAHSTIRSTSDLFDSQPMTPYLMESKKKYTISIDQQAAQTWYKKTMTQSGYTLSGTGSTENTNTGMSSTALTFTKKKNQNLTVIISFKKLAAHQTLIQYDVQYIATTKREKGSLLPKNLKEVTLTYKPYGYLNTHQKETKTLTDPKQLDSLRTQINNLTPDTGGVRSCAADTGQGAVLHFLTTDQETFDVTINPACGDVSVNHGQSLSDHDLWTSVSKLFPDIKQ